MKYNANSFKTSPTNQKSYPESEDTSLDPGNSIRRIGLAVFSLLLLIGVPMLIFGYNAINVKWGIVMVTKKAAVCIGIGTILISTAGSMLLPLLSLAAWRTSKWRCELAKKHQAIDSKEDVLSVPLEGSLHGWTNYWVVLSWVGGFVVVAFLLLFCVNLDYNHSVIVVSDQIIISPSSIVASVVSSSFVAECFCILWVICLKDHLREVEDIKRLVQSRAPRKNADWTETQIKQIISDMVPIPGKNVSMGKFEVTQDQWEAVMGSNPASFKGKGFPVETVSWHECVEFCSKLNDIPIVAATGAVFRLPTEEEWEYACRAGSKGEYGRLSNETEISQKTLGEVAWFAENSDRRTHTVGKKQPNAFGLYDMHGNVWEWTSTTDGENRVSRGGCWLSSARFCESSSRLWDSPSCRYDFLGFRLCASGKAD